MKLSVFIIALLIVGGGIFIALSQNDSSQKTSNSPTPQALSFQTIQTDISSGGQLIDVRTPEEFTTSHIDGAINLSLQNIQAGTLPNVAKDQKVYLYCRSGNRSAEAKVILNNAGYTNIIDLGAMTYVESLGGTIKS